MMMPELIIYNYCTEVINQSTALKYIDELIKDIKRYGINTRVLRVVNGNEKYMETHSLIRDILDYWWNHNHFIKDLLPTKNIYQSFLTLKEHLKKEKVNGYCVFLKNDIMLPDAENKKICRELIDIAEGVKILPSFFNSIIITGKKYMLEYPWGVNYGRIDKGGICIIDKILKENILHETAHLLGTDECYDEKPPHRPLKTCDNPSCFMRYGNIGANSFCTKRIVDIKRFIDSLNWN